MSYCSGPYAIHSVLPSPDRTVLSSSRKIDAPTGTYVIGEDGGFESMPSTAQRVLLLVSFASGEKEKFVTPSAMNSLRDRARKALLVLTGGRTPLIQLQLLEVTSPSAGSMKLRVDYKDLTTGLSQSVQL